MPFLDSGNRAQSISETIDAISMIESIIVDHPHHSVVIGGDLNTELKNESPFDPYWNALMTNHNLSGCANLFTGPTYTYHHQSLDQKKFNDHFIVSKRLLDERVCDGHRILEDGENPSNHLPITMWLRVDASRGCNLAKQSIAPETLKWTKVSDEQKSIYSSNLAHAVGELECTAASCKLTFHCNRPECIGIIQAQYDCLVNSIKHADAYLPRCRKGKEKEWWTQDLSQLKKQSIQIQNAWISQGRPRSGPIFQERLQVCLAYRRAIKQAQIAPKQKS